MDISRYLIGYNQRRTNVSVDIGGIEIPKSISDQKPKQQVYNVLK